MPASQQRSRRQDFSGALQNATSPRLRRANEVEESINFEYATEIGAAKRRPGYELVSVVQHGQAGTMLDVYNSDKNSRLVVGINDASNNGTFRYLDSTSNWNSLITDAPENTRFRVLNDLGELYVVGRSDAEFMTTRNIDQDDDVSTTRSLIGAPKAAYIAEFNGQIYLANVELNGVRYPDRVYRSSAPLGAITFIRTDQFGPLTSLKVDSVRYLKVGMTVEIYKAGTDILRHTRTIVDVDKAANRIGFLQGEQIDVSDNDEVWLSGRKNKLTRFWNTDYPTQQNSEFFDLEPGRENTRSITGIFDAGGRLLIFTKGSVIETDGSNLLTLSDRIGCISDKTIRQVREWVVWLHTTGIWGYNTTTGELLLLSRSITKYIQSMKQAESYKMSATSLNNQYKVFIGEINELDSVTTSTSTSSTSTSSTSTSTSSTSTSSTTTVSSTSTSTSSTSTSTSSTSTSTSSTSTSSTSTSTTTTASARQTYRLVYDFDLNAAWVELHRRDMRDHTTYTMHGYTKTYFVDETGRVFRDETGNKDGDDTIPCRLKLGADDMGYEMNKTFIATYFDTDPASGITVSYSVDGKDYQGIGTLRQKKQDLTIMTPDNDTDGLDINYILSHNADDSGPAVREVTTYFRRIEDKK